MDNPEWTADEFALAEVGPPWAPAAEAATVLRATARKLRDEADRMEAEAERLERAS